MTSYLSREKFKALYEKYERHITSGALVFGFLVDNFTLKRIDLLFENLVLFGYLALAGVGIVFANLYTGGVVKGRFSEKVYPWAPLAMQYAFGGLFSGFLIFYTRSASLVASWPFLVFLVVLLIGNEFLKKRYLRLSFQMGIYFVAIFSFAIFYVPILLGTMGVGVFLLSGVISLVVMGIILFSLSRIIPERIRESKKILLVGISGIFAAINIFYFTNIIPPIPLSLKEAGVYHFVERTGNNNYLVKGEIEEWYEFLEFSDEIHIAPGGAVYVYSAVFSPTSLNINIVHNWQYFDSKKDKWLTATRIKYPIIGGRDGGYRGFSFKNNVSAGIWQVRVETERGQLLGRVKFKVQNVAEQPQLETDIK